MPHPLDGCNAKLDRAREHLSALQDAHDQYLRSKPFIVEGSFDATTGLYRFIGKVLEPPPLRIGVVLGDLIHNLRSALDHLVCQLVLANGREPSNHNHFPVCKAESDWGKARVGHLRCVREEHAKVIHGWQPFHSHAPKRTPLARLNSLWNEDKHRLVMPVLASTRDASGITAIRRTVSEGTFTGNADVAEMTEGETFNGTPIDGHVLAQIRIVTCGPKPEIGFHGRWIAGLQFPDGESIEATVNEMATVVEGIVNHFGLMLSCDP